MHDLQGADLLLDNINAPRLLADKAYDADYRVLKRLEKKHPVSNTIKIKS